MYEIPKLQVKFYRKKWRIMVGKSSLSAFSKEEDAIKELAAKQGFYEYWAGSASVQAENTEPVIVIIDK